MDMNLDANAVTAKKYVISDATSCVSASGAAAAAAAAAASPAAATDSIELQFHDLRTYSGGRTS